MGTTADVLAAAAYACELGGWAHRGKPAAVKALLVLLRKLRTAPVRLSAMLDVRGRAYNEQVRRLVRSGLLASSTCKIADPGDSRAELRYMIDSDIATRLETVLEDGLRAQAGPTDAQFIAAHVPGMTHLREAACWQEAARMVTGKRPGRLRPIMLEALGTDADPRVLRRLVILAYFVLPGLRQDEFARLFGRVKEGKP
jgi:hypothetical protein